MRRPGPWLAGLGLFLVYAALAGGHTYSVDGFLIFEQGRSLALHASIRFAEPVHWGGTYTISKYGIGPSLLYAPFIWLLTHAGVRPPYLPQVHVDGLYAWIGPWLAAAVTAATAVLVANVVGEAGGSARARGWAFALFALASPALIYARGDWAQPLSGLAWMAALNAALRLRRDPGTWMLVALAAAVLLGLLTRVVDGALAAATVGIVLFGRPRALAVLAFAAAAGIAITGIVSWARFGSPFATGYAEGWSTPLPVGLAGALFSPARGLLWQFPALVLFPFGSARLWKRGDRALVLALLGGCLAELVSTAAWRYWWGGYDWGLRLFVPAIPLLAVLAGGGVDSLRGRWRTLVPAVCLAAGLLSSVPPLFVDMNAGYAHFADGTAASWQIGAYPLLGALRFASRSGIDLFWLRASHSHRTLLLVPAVLLAAGLWLLRRQLGAPTIRRPPAPV